MELPRDRFRWSDICRLGALNLPIERGFQEAAPSRLSTPRGDEYRHFLRLSRGVR
jgi:hypothetical protein